MFRYILQRRILRQFQPQFFGRTVLNFKHNDSKSTILPGGGLEKLQGGIKEEKYFNRMDMELFLKIRKQGAKLMCERCMGNWEEFEKVLDAGMKTGSLRDTCSPNKHRNPNEEAFFLSEQNDSCKLMKGQIGLKASKPGSPTKKITAASSAVLNLFKKPRIDP